MLLVASPVLVGRDEFVALADRRLAEAAAGSGQLLFVAGEAGIGKTRLLSVLTRHAEAAGVTVLRGAAFPGDAQSVAGLLLDLASDLQAAGPGPADTGRRLAARIRAFAQPQEGNGLATGPSGDAHHRRRLAVQDLTDLLLRLDGPALVVLEDLHWADELSLEVLGHLAGRIRARAVLVAGAYRSDELYPRLPMRTLRARLIGQRLAEEIRLPRLGAAAVGTIASAALGQVVPADVVAAIHARSDGIPLHVEELLAATFADPGTVAVIAVPDTLADAVRTRFAQLDPAALAVAQAAAVIGRSFDFDLLAAVAAQASPDDVAAGLASLRDAYFVVPGADLVSFDFRHALIRDVLYADLPVPARRRLHEAVATAALARGYAEAFISAQFEQAGNVDLAHRHALAAGREAAAMSSHREALELFRRALRCQPVTGPADTGPADTGPADTGRVWLLAAAGDEAAATDDNQAAADFYGTAHALLTGSGDVRGAAALTPRMAAVAHLLGERLETRLASLQAALDSLDGLAQADGERAALRSAMAAAYMLSRHLDKAIEHGRGSLPPGAQLTDPTALNTAASLGSALVFAGRTGEGWNLLEQAVAGGLSARLEAEAARGYRMIGSCASVLVEYDRAEHWLTEGIGYAEQVELWNHRHYMAAHLGHVQWAVGDWAAAASTAEHALADGRGGITTRITAQYVLGYLALGRADWPAAQTLLAQALKAGEQMAELQRLSPPLWGLAEAALLRGDLDAAITACERGYAASAQVTDAAYLFPYLVTGVRAYLRRDGPRPAAGWAERVGKVLASRAVPGTLPAIEHARGLLLAAGGSPAAAQAALTAAHADWQRLRRFWEGTWALVDMASVAAARQRRGEARALAGQAQAAAEPAAATVITAAADRVLQSLGRGRRTWDPSHPLSPREYEVAELVAAGLTNREIAQRLVLAPKTVSAHVEHILAKLGMARRAEVAAWCAGRLTDEAARPVIPAFVGRAAHAGSVCLFHHRSCSVRLRLVRIGESAGIFPRGLSALSGKRAGTGLYLGVLVTRSRLVPAMVATVLLGLAGLAAGCASSTPAASSGSAASASAAPTGPVKLAETGSSLLYPLMSAWASAYHQQYGQITISTASTGSGAGITGASKGTADIGASDAYLSSGNLVSNPSLLNIPVAISAQQVNYNLPGLSPAVHLRLNGTVLAQMYSGTITTWDSPAIAALNPGVRIPALPVVPVHRSDSSGDTFLFTSYLATDDPAWNNDIGYGTTVAWPAVRGNHAVQGNSGMVQACAATPGCLAYVGISYLTKALSAGLGYAELANAAGTYVPLTATTIAAAAESFVSLLPPNETISMINGPAPDGYPIVNYEYVIVSSHQRSTARAAALRQFLQWAITQGNAASFLGPVRFQPLPAEVVSLARAQIARIGS